MTCVVIDRTFCGNWKKNVIYVHMNIRYAGFWSEVFWVPRPVMHISQPALVIFDVFFLFHVGPSIAILNTVGTIEK